ncbi:hypothetical protein EHS15_08000 [Leptospira idonii]|uniref:Lipoprotein n=1 Tax=Leptospira idonii TaxID=1193500 RepID=A0A4R9M158_9LEPT|nr:hypothetical protein EHS15_08000 [Leptospira idonii]
MRFFFLIQIVFLSACMLSREEQISEECEKQRQRSYLYMMTLLERVPITTDKSTAQTIYVLNTESYDIRCRSEARKNRYNLRSN